MSVLELLPDLRRTGATAGGEYAGPCPWCGGTDRFRLWPSHPSGKTRFWCRRCEKSGDEIDLRRTLLNSTYSEAATAAGVAATDCPATPATRRQESPMQPPCATWQSRAEKVAVEAEHTLWSAAGRRALDYLRHRGLTDDTIRAARLGFLPGNLKHAPNAWGLPVDHRAVWLPRGITIPWRACGSLWRLNIRRAQDSPRYTGPAGAASSPLYGADGVRGDGRPVVLVEGEFDALAVTQTGGNLVAAVATGSTSGARHSHWRRRLATAPCVLVAYDNDDAGERGSDWWLKRLDNARRLVPMGEKDPAAMLEDGGDVLAWVLQGLDT